LTSLLPYEVLVVDDEKRLGSWGELTKMLLEGHEFKVDHVYSLDEATQAIKKKGYDIFIIDLFLQTAESGLDLQKQLRGMGRHEPIILVTGQRDYLSQPLSNYADNLAQGPLQFYEKNSTLDLLQVVREVSNRIDPIRRSFRLMEQAGLGNKEFGVSGRKYTVSQLLQSSITTDDLVRTLRESLYALVLENQAVGSDGRQSS